MRAGLLLFDSDKQMKFQMNTSALNTYGCLCIVYCVSFVLFSCMQCIRIYGNVTNTQTQSLLCILDAKIMRANTGAAEFILLQNLFVLFFLCFVEILNFWYDA